MSGHHDSKLSRAHLFNHAFAVLGWCTLTFEVPTIVGAQPTPRRTHGFSLFKEEEAAECEGH
jgi:hypothetical protein